MWRERTYIKEWRLYRGIKQESLAAATGLSVATISQIESGKRGYTRTSLEAIAAALDTTAGLLLFLNPHNL